MRTNASINMTQGGPTGLLLRFAIPMLIGNIFQQAYSLADSVIVGQFVGASALAAVGSTGSVTFLFFSVCNGIVEVICRIGLPLLLVLIPGIGLWSIWWTAGVTWLISGLSCLMRYFVWRRKAEAQTAE